MNSTPVLRRSLFPDSIPEALRSQKRWAPFSALWNAKRAKFDKIPMALKPHTRKMSTAAPSRWFAFEQALEACEKHPEHAGIGFVLTGITDMVGLDLDHCVDPGTGTLTAWAQTIVDTAASYTEISPSGTGIRILVYGRIADFTDHKVGIEVYQGDSPRFLTVTGNHVAGTPTEVTKATPDLLALLETYRTKPKDGTSTSDKAPMPFFADLKGEELLAELVDDCRLAPSVAKELQNGLEGDKSGRLQHLTKELRKAGLSQAECMAVLAVHPGAVDVALAHRSNKQDKADVYLWDHHVLAAWADEGAAPPVVEFEDLRTPAEKAADDEDQPTASAETITQPNKRRNYFTATEVAQRPPMKWLIHGVLPLATVGCNFGPSGSGKSFVVMAMAHSLVLGADFWDNHVPCASRTLYVGLEGSAGLGRRVKAHQQHHGVDHGDRLMVVEGSLDLLSKDDLKAFSKEVKALGKFGTIWIDTAAQATAGANENSGEDMGRMLAHCKLLARFTGAMVILVDHTGKDESRGARGWSGKKGAMDVQFEVVQLQRGRVLRIDKQKDGDDSTEWPFELKVVPLGVDDDGRPVTSCVAVPVAAGAVSVDKGKAVDRFKAWARGANQQAIEAALRDLWMFERSPVKHAMLVREATRHRMAEARKFGEDRNKKTCSDGIRDAIAAMVKDGRLLMDEAAFITAPNMPTAQTYEPLPPVYAVDEEA